MPVLGNLCLAGAVLFLLGLLNFGVLNKAPGGDAGVGHAFVIFLLIAGFLVCMTIVTIAVGQQGGFSAFGNSSSVRFWLGAGWFLIVMLGFYRYADPGTGLPLFLRVAGTILLPLFLLTWGAVHLNGSLSRSLPPGAPNALTKFVFVLGCLPLAAKILSGLFGNVLAFTRRGELDSFQQGIVAQIDTTDVQNGIYNLLVYTSKEQHSAIREKALAKIKSRPDWQEELIRLLKTEATSEVFKFLSSNEVDNPAIFPEAINEGLFQQARYIRQRIRESNHPSHLYEGMLSTEVRLALLVADRYQNTGVDYRPAVREIRNAFDEPSPYDKPKFVAIERLDRWLKKQGK